MSEFYNPPINQAVHDALMQSLEVKFERAGVGSDIREDVRELFNTIKEDSIRDQVSSQLDVLAASKIGVELGLFQQTQQQLRLAQQKIKDSIHRLKQIQKLKEKLERMRSMLLESENSREVQQQRADYLANVLRMSRKENVMLTDENESLLTHGQTLKVENETLKKRADNMANVLMKCSDEITTLRVEKQALLVEKQKLLAEKQELLADNKAQKKRVVSLEKKQQEDDDDEIQIIKDDEIQIIEPPVRSSS